MGNENGFVKEINSAGQWGEGWLSGNKIPSENGREKDGCRDGTQKRERQDMGIQRQGLKNHREKRLRNQHTRMASGKEVRI